MKKEVDHAKASLTGGLTTKLRHGREHYVKIAKKSAEVRRMKKQQNTGGKL